jgi:hypothetical protein
MAKKRRKRFYNEGSYEGLESARNQEREDFDMISEGRNDIANLPQDVKYYLWSMSEVGENEDLDDTIRGIDEQIRDDATKHGPGGIKNKKFPEKY